jgi:putative flippase GtrA
LRQFLRFCIVGTLGFLVDAGVLQGLVTVAQVNPYAARVASFLVAASFTWWLNRRFTFAVPHRATHSEWARYVTLMTLGALVNYAAYAISITMSDVVRVHLWLGVAIGSIAGLGINYASSRALVFRDSRRA